LTTRAPQNEAKHTWL